MKLPWGLNWFDVIAVAIVASVLIYALVSTLIK
jgi:hypothetical protein